MLGRNARDPNAPPPPDPHRTRLRPWPQPGLAARLVVALAGPGWGKSQALAALVQEDPDARVRWVEAQAHEAEGPDMAEAVVRAFRHWGPQLGQATSTLAGQGASPEALGRALGAELGSAGLGPWWLVVDDAHHWGASGGAFLGALAEALPPEARLAIASRQQAPFSLVRWRAKGQALVLGHADLALSPEEQAAWWAKQRPDGAPPEALAQAEAMEGWPLGLALLASHGAPRGATWAPGDEAELLAALAETHLESLPEAWAQAMLEAALPERFDAELMEGVFGLPDAQAWLAQLRASHLVGQPTGQPPQHRYLPALREGLRLRAQATLPPAQWRSWHGLLAQRLAYEDPQAAMGHALEAGNPEEALAIAQTAFPEWWAQGRTQAIATWLGRLPVAFAQGHPLALLWRGRLAERAGQGEEAAAAYRLSAERAQALGDEAAHFAAAVRSASLAAARDDEGAFREALNEALDGLEAARRGDRCDLLLAQAQMADRHGSLQAARAYNQEVLAIPVGDEHDVAHAHGVALQNLCAYALNAGQLAEAQSWLSHWAAHLDRHQLESLRPSLALYGGILALNRGDAAGVGLALQSLPEAWPQTLAWQEAALSHELSALHAMHRKAWPEAHDHVAAAQRLHEGAGHAGGLRGLCEVAIQVASRQGLWAEAQRRFESLGELDPHDLYDQQALLAWCACLVAADRPAEAQPHLEGLLPLLDPELKLARARALSLLALASGEAAPLAEALPLMEDGGLGHLLVSDERLWARWRPLLAGLPAGQGLLAELDASHPLPAAPVAPSAPAGSAGAWGAQEQLSVRLFGDFELRQGDRLLGPWPRRKAKALLAMLVLYPRGLHRVELAAALFGEGGKAEQSLRTTNSALRAILEPDLAPRAPSRYLLIQDERYLLAPEALAYADVREWGEHHQEAEKHRLRGDWAAAAPSILALAKLHRGPLLDEAQLHEGFEAERERFRKESQALIRWLAEAHQGAQAWALALPLWQQLVALDPCSEEDVLGLMQARLGQGAQDLARFAWWDHRKALKSQLGLGPSPESEALASRLLKGEAL